MGEEEESGRYGRRLQSESVSGALCIGVVWVCIVEMIVFLGGICMNIPYSRTLTMP